MTHAIIIVGNSKGFLDESLAFRNYLHNFARITTNTIRAAYMSEDTLRRKLMRILQLHYHEPVLIVYNGHGEKEGWAPNEDCLFRYDSLSLLLLFRQQPTIIIGDCCCSGALIREMKKTRLDFELFEVITSADGRRKCFGGLLEDVQNFWMEGKYFVPDKKTKVIYKKNKEIKKCFVWQMRYGAYFDSLCFVKH